MIAYRIEWSDGSGIYTGQSALFGMIHDEITEPSRHPSPNNDSMFRNHYEVLGWGSKRETRDLRWAFESLESLRWWFYNDDWVRRISEHGGMLCTYEVDDQTTVVGRTQVAFDCTTAKCIFKEPLVNVLEKV